MEERLDAPIDVTMVTGTLGNAFLRSQVLSALPRIENLRIEMAPVTNQFFGDSVTVSGLLTGQDILQTIEHETGNGVVMLPPNCLNEDGLLLDNMTVEDVERRLKHQVIIGSYDFVESLLTLIRDSES